MADDGFDPAGAARAWADTQARLWNSWVESAGVTTAAAEATTGYFSSVMEDFTKLLETTTGSRASGTEASPGVEEPEDGESVFRQLAGTWWDNWERTAGRLLASPSVGYTREFNEKLFETSASWLRFRRASFDYEVLLGEAWAKSAEQFARRLGAQAEKGDGPTSFRDLIRLWTEVTDEVLIDAFRSERFVRAQGRLVDAAMEYRLSEREVVESLLKHSHLPSRREVDDLSQRVHQLRRELREVRRRLPGPDARKEGS